MQRHPTTWRGPSPESCKYIVNSQTPVILSDPGLESEAFDGRRDCERQVPEGSDGIPSVVEYQPPVEEEIADFVRWG